MRVSRKRDRQRVLMTFSFTECVLISVFVAEWLGKCVCVCSVLLTCVSLRFFTGEVCVCVQFY